MTDNSKYIRTGFYDDFKGYDTVLISVDIDGLLEIENAFLQLAQGLASFDFSTLKHLDRIFHVDIKAFNDTTNIGLKQIDKSKFEWRLTSVLWNQFREMTTALYGGGKGGHQYLDSETNNFNGEENYIDTGSLQVVLSLNEYPLSFWREHFGTSNR
ncbi:MAG: hypothetical protein ACJ75B_22505 [Flavisolibacter sp.]